AEMAMQSLLLPVKVVSDGPIYHLYFAVRWWKAGRLFLVAAPFGENAATYFPANGDVWFTWLMVAWGGDRLARIGQAPFLWLAAIAVFRSGRMLGASRNSALLATFWFVTVVPLLLFSFEANVDTIFVAFYLIAVYFFLLDFHAAAGTAALVLGGLAAGIALGTKPVGVVFVPPLLVLVLAAKGARSRSARKTIAAFLLILFCLLLTSGFWFGRNYMLTGNPLYPLHVELFGRSILSGWYGRDAMRFSIYFVPITEWRALIDILLAVADPRLAPFWIAALAGAWAIGGRGAPEQDRLTWTLSALAELNVALYWICIPYRTQQRFMLQALGLAAVPLARLLDRWRGLRGAAAALLILHLLTTQTWPVTVEESKIPWDLSPFIPNAVGAALPLFARMDRALHMGPDAAAIAGIVLVLGMGCCAGLAVWAGSRPNAAAGRGLKNRALLVAGGLGLVGLAALQTGASALDAGQLFYPPFRMFYPGWLDLESRSGPSGARLAYAGTNIPYYLFGTGLRNDVRYVNVDAHPDWLMHDYHRAALDRKEPTWPNSRPGWDRAHPNFQAWLSNLKAQQIQLLVVTRANSAEGPHNVADSEGFPIERLWADSHPELFEPLYGPKQQDPFFRLYRLRGWS
ncbi:MAG: ArnT family glycosyltransferase, partial [Isosphaeraceae bacterium]